MGAQGRKHPGGAGVWGSTINCILVISGTQCSLINRSPGGRSPGKPGPRPVSKAARNQLTNRRRRTFITKPSAKNMNNVAEPP